MSVQPLVLNRHFDAAPERVFAAFTEQALMQSWYGPETMTAPRCDVDARVGGAYRIELHGAAGLVSIVTGVFTEFDPPRKLAFTWGWLNGGGRNPETFVTLTFTPRDGGTDLELVQTGFAKEEFRAGHNDGWTSALRSLEASLDGRPKPAAAGLTLLGDPRSNYVRAARMAFEEKGIAYALKPSRPHSPDMLAVHPWGRMPGLQLGDKTLFETSAILRFVDEAFPGPALMPVDPFERARVEQWISAFNAYLDRAFVRDYVLPNLFPSGPDGKPDAARIAEALPTMRKGLAILEQGYGGRAYLVGESMSLADILLAPAIAPLPRFPESAALLADFPHVRRAHAAMAARASFAATEFRA